MAELEPCDVCSRPGAQVFRTFEFGEYETSATLCRECLWDTIVNGHHDDDRRVTSLTVFVATPAPGDELMVAPNVIRCDDCGAYYDNEDALERTGYLIPDLWDRIEPGETVPVGECNRCGSLAYAECLVCRESKPTWKEHKHAASEIQQAQENRKNQDVEEDESEDEDGQDRENYVPEMGG